MSLATETDNELLERLPARRRAEITAGRNGWSLDAWPELDVSGLMVLDGPLGLVSAAMDERETGTVLPSATSLAATWSPSAARNVGQVLGAEARQRGIDVVLGPNLNLPRLQRSGRSFEMFSEDPLLTGIIGSAWIEGLQAWGVAACAKHLVCNDTETKRQVMNADISEKNLREIYLLPFEYAADAGVWSMMTAYNRFRGLPCVEQPQLTRILREEWGYDGVVMSDYFATKDTVATAEAGIDLEMPGPARFYGSALADAIDRGDVEADVANNAARNLIRLARRVGAIPGGGEPTPAAINPTAILRNVSAQATVLLKNQNEVLPLTPLAGERIAIIGPNATRPCYQGGTFARVNLPPGTPTPLDVLQLSLQPAQVTTAQGTRPVGLESLETLETRAPDGAAGLLVEYFLPNETLPAASEIRPGSTLVWFNDIPGLGTPRAGGRIRLSGSIQTQTEREIDLHLGGTGEAELTVNGVTLVTWDRPAPGDVMGVVARADTTSATVVVRADTVTRFVAEFRLEPGRVQAVTLGWSELNSGDLIGKAVETAANADTVILFVGDEVSSSRESADRSSTKLPDAQVELIQRVAAVCKRTIVVVNASRAIDLSWDHLVDSVILCWFGGAEMSHAIADVLTGVRSPDGRLPITLAQSDDAYPGWNVTLDADDTLHYDGIEPAGYMGFQALGRRPRYAFGYGLSYTTLNWLSVDMVAIDSAKHTVKLSVTVDNAGKRRGREIVQVYAQASTNEPRRLAAFAELSLEPGESGTVIVDVDKKAFRRWDEAENDWIIPPTMLIHVGPSVEQTIKSFTVGWEHVGNE